MAPRTRTVDLDAYPTIPRAELANLINLLASGVSLPDSQSVSTPEHGLHCDIEEEPQEPDSGYSSQHHSAGATIRQDGVAAAQGMFCTRRLASYTPTGALHLPAKTVRTSRGTEHIRYVDSQQVVEVDLYDDDGFLIESIVDTPLLLSHESKGDHKSQLPCTHAPKIITLGRKHQRPQQITQRNNSQFSFEANTSEEATVPRRDVVDAEKKRKQRQEVLGLEGCALILDETQDGASDEDEERKAALFGDRFEHAYGASMLRCPGSLDEEVSQLAEPSLPPLLQQDGAAHLLPDHGVQMVHTQHLPLMNSPEYAQYMSAMQHPLAMTFGTAQERVAWRGQQPNAFGERREENAACYCALCSSLHVGRRAEALDSVIEGLCANDEAFGRGEQEGEEEQCSWCWPFRRRGHSRAAH